MAETPKSNLDPKEATEAKLCAYLEGDLAPAEQAEIEKYLANNTAHRQLLTELKKTHGLLSSLPRESAPAEIAEAFNLHMERSLLLDDTDHEASVRTNRWPQRMAIAAIVLLTFCLGGLVVYIVLPGRMTPQKLAVAPAPLVVVPPKVDLSKQVAQSDVLVTQQAAKSLVVTSPPPVAVPTAGLATADDRAPAAALTPASIIQPAKPMQISLAARPLDTQMLAPARRVAQANDLPANNTVYLVVSTDNPDASAGQVRDFFQNNSFAYKTLAPDGSVVPAGSQNSNTDPLLPIPRPFGLADGGGRAAAGNMTQQQEQSQTRSLGVAENRQREDQQSVQLQGAADALKSSGGSEQTFVARAIPRTLAVELNTALSTQRPGQTSDVYYLPTDESAEKFSIAAATISSLPHSGGGGGFGGGTSMTAAPTTMPSTEPSQTITTDQSLTVTIDQLVGPGVDKTSNIHVATDGTITLPMIEPVVAAGLTPAELQREIADKYRQNNLIPDARVTVAIAQPTTQSVASESTTQPITSPAEAANAPTTQPGNSDTVNVVVLVQAANGPPATTEPTTQPAATQPINQ